METMKPNLLRNVLVRLFLLSLLLIVVRFAYLVAIRGESCDLGDFCFFSSPENLNLVVRKYDFRSSAMIVDDAVLSAPPRRDGRGMAVLFYSSVFQDLIAEGYLSVDSKALCIGTPSAEEASALKEIGVKDATGIYKKPARQPFDDNTFDFIFSGVGQLDNSPSPAEFAAEVSRMLRPEGFLVVHTASKDTYSFNSFIDLFNCCKFVRTREIEGFDSSHVREIVMKKENRIVRDRISISSSDGNSLNNCSVPGYKQQLIRKAEPLIAEEPLKPWITLKRNVKNIKYLPSMADISFRQRYVYIDVGSRTYGSSIVSWFKKQYPKQNKTFEIYAIEADKAFHEEYRHKKGVTLLPYAAWVRDETLLFEVNQDPGRDTGKGRGMGRIQPVKSSDSVGDVDNVQGFDFANWLKNTVSDKDYVVMKMDVEGTEFELIPRLFETGAICLIDEVFLECHYNRWQKCCPGERSSKYEKTYGQCLELFTSLRDNGVLVHQWW